MTFYMSILKEASEAGALQQEESATPKKHCTLHLFASAAQLLKARHVNLSAGLRLRAKLVVRTRTFSKG
jgi:hypothetical protein